MILSSFIYALICTPFSFRSFCESTNPEVLQEKGHGCFGYCCLVNARENPGFFQYVVHIHSKHNCKVLLKTALKKLPHLIVLVSFVMYQYRNRAASRTYPNGWASMAAGLHVFRRRKKNTRIPHRNWGVGVGLPEWQ